MVRFIMEDAFRILNTPPLGQGYHKRYIEIAFVTVQTISSLRVNNENNHANLGTEKNEETIVKRSQLTSNYSSRLKSALKQGNNQ
jgi:hypothetical protein